MYSQNNEEKVILDYFAGRTGTFLDLGAADGKTFSNTRALLERGWIGHLVEGSPEQFLELMHLKELFPKTANLYQMIMGTETGIVDFYIGHGQVSSLNKDLMYSYGGIKETIRLMACTLDDLPSEALDADFVSIDLDGINVDFLQANDLYLPDFEVICIEHESRQDEIRKILNRHEVVYESAENLILVCEENRRVKW